jgi:hypothetical protein
MVIFLSLDFSYGARKGAQLETNWTELIPHEDLPRPSLHSSTPLRTHIATSTRTTAHHAHHRTMFQTLGVVTAACMLVAARGYVLPDARTEFIESVENRAAPRTMQNGCTFWDADEWVLNCDNLALTEVGHFNLATPIGPARVHTIPFEICPCIDNNVYLQNLISPYNVNPDYVWERLLWSCCLPLQARVDECHTNHDASLTE